MVRCTVQSADPLVIVVRAISLGLVATTFPI